MEANGRRPAVEHQVVDVGAMQVLLLPMIAQELMPLAQARNVWSTRLDRLAKLSH